MRASGPIRSLLPAAMLAFGVTAASLSATAQEDKPPLSVTVDQAIVLQLERPADVVIVGNPGIADIAVMDATMLVLTGRSVGTTNLIALDGDGTTILNEIVTVGSPDSLVTVFRRAARQTYSCATVCNPVLTVGDSEDQFNAIAGQIQSRGGFAAAQ